MACLHLNMTFQVVNKEFTLYTNQQNQDNTGTVLSSKFQGMTCGVASLVTEQFD